MLNRMLTREFWLTGALLLVGLIIYFAVGVWWHLTEMRSAESTAFMQVYATHQSARWALDEWQHCNHGDGDYSPRGYITTEQCRMAVEVMATKRNQTADVVNALNDLDTNRRAAIDLIQPPWLLEPVLTAIFKMLY